MVEQAADTYILFRNIAAKQVEKYYARFAASRAQTRH